MNEYPTFKVTLLYTVIGGIVCGFFCGAIFAEMMFFNLSDIPQTVNSFFLGGLCGSMIGIIPATITGFFIAKLKIYKYRNSYLPLMASIGFFCSFISVFVIFLSFYDDLYGLIFFGLLFGIMGAISAIITGYLVLPKSLNKVNGNE